MRVRVNRCFGVALTVLVVALSGAALTASASKDEAVAMVKKAVAAIKAEGADKAYAEMDVDGKEFVKERVELAKTESSFWQSYKYLNPVTKAVEPKQMYCERLNDTVVCGGVYQS
jgi:cytochrome c